MIELSGVMEIFCILIQVVVVTLVYRKIQLSCTLQSYAVYALHYYVFIFTSKRKKPLKSSNDSLF